MRTGGAKQEVPGSDLGRGREYPSFCSWHNKLIKKKRMNEHLWQQ